MRGDHASCPEILLYMYDSFLNRPIVIAIFWVTSIKYPYGMDGDLNRRPMCNLYFILKECAGQIPLNHGSVLGAHSCVTAQTDSVAI